MIKTIKTFRNKTAPWLSLFGLSLLLLSLTLAGCDTDDPVVVDLEPPAVPTGVFSVTGDGLVSVYWNDIYDEDLVGYDVYRHDGSDPENGPYDYLGTVGWDENYLEASILHWFDDYEVVNGETYYYAVLSFDEAGNESYLSFEYVPDTPRPEGSGVVLYDNAVDPGKSGFDFSRLDLGRQAGNDSSTDIYIEYSAGVPFVVAARPLVVDLQDYGTQHLSNVDYAPQVGYSEAGRIELIEGHSYIVRITESPLTHINYAKFQVVTRGPESVLIDWAYQTDNNNQELSEPTGPIAQPGRGSASPRNDIVRF